MKTSNNTLMRILALVLVLCLCVGNYPVKADGNISISTYDSELVSAYMDLSEYISANGIDADISLETFADEYENGSYGSVPEYLDEYYDMLVVPQNGDVSILSDSDAQKWYYNTSLALPVEPNYGTYNLLQVVQPGDIIYDAAGGWGFTGHVSIVEGIFYSAKYSRFYIRLIEAIGYSGSVGAGDGVCRGVLDDDRYDDREATILRVSGATDEQKEEAINFCISQIGKDFSLDLDHGISSSEASWYCSELVWAAYYNQGIDLETSNSLPGITPSELLNSTATTTVTKSTVGTPVISSITASSNTSVTLNWNTVYGATVYYIYRSSAYAGEYTQIGSSTNPLYTDYGLTAGSTYYYYVTAYKSAHGNPSMIRGVKLSFTIPSIMRSCTPSSTSVSLMWTAVYGATGYYVYRSTTSTGTYTKIATVSGTSYTDSLSESETSYYYRIVAYNSSTTSANSATSSVRATVSAVPSIYYGKANSTSSITIKWSNTPNCNYYEIYRSTSANGDYVFRYSSSSTSCTDIDLSAGTRYYYKVVAYVNNVPSEYSTYKAVTTKTE